MVTQNAILLGAAAIGVGYLFLTRGGGGEGAASTGIIPLAPGNPGAGTFGGVFDTQAAGDLPPASGVTRDDGFGRPPISLNNRRYGSLPSGPDSDRFASPLERGNIGAANRIGVDESVVNASSSTERSGMVPAHIRELYAAQQRHNALYGNVGSGIIRERNNVRVTPERIREIASLSTYPTGQREREILRRYDPNDFASVL